MSATDRAALIDALLADPGRAAAVPRADALALLVELARVQRALELLPTATPAPITPTDDGAALSVDDVMELTGLSRRAVFVRAHPTKGLPEWRPYLLRQGKKTLHFKPTFRRWLARRG